MNTPRTDAEDINILDRDFVTADFARQLERELAESHAREAQLRDALLEVNDWVLTAEQLAVITSALTIPPPSVIPLADVKPLVNALKSASCDLSAKVSTFNLCRSVLREFTSKHPQQ